METIAIKNSVVKNITYALCGLILIALSLYLLYFPNQPILNFIGGAGIFISGLMTFIHLIHVFDRQPRLIINDEGVHDKELSIGVIDWYDIKNVYLQKIGESRFVCFILEDEEKYLSEPSQENIIASSIQNHFGMEKININIDSLDIEDEDLIRILKREISQHENPPKPVSIFDLD